MTEQIRNSYIRLYSLPNAGFYVVFVRYNLPLSQASMTQAIHRVRN